MNGEDYIFLILLSSMISLSPVFKVSYTSEPVKFPQKGDINVRDKYHLGVRGFLRHLYVNLQILIFSSGH